MIPVRSPAWLTIVADDLTGALDTAGPFASRDRPVGLVLQGEGQGAAIAGRVATSTESRDAGRAEAVAAARAAARARLAAAGRRGLWFKKVDSVLRGHPFDEILAIADEAGFDRIVFAPAFPEQGRRTVGGRQEARTAEGWAQVGEHAVNAFRARGVEVAAGSDARDARVVVLDATTPEDLDRIAHDLAPVVEAEGCLVAGSGGLAEALAGRPALEAVASPDLVVVGSTHPVMRAQIADALELGLLVVFAASPHAVPPSPCAARPLLVLPDEGVTARAEAEGCIVAAVGELAARGDAPRRLFVSGGATLSLVARATGSFGIECTGRIGPGLPVSRLVGGAWQGCTIVSKSGGFGGRGLLSSLLKIRT